MTDNNAGKGDQEGRVAAVFDENTMSVTITEGDRKGETHQVSRVSTAEALEMLEHGHPDDLWILAPAPEDDTAHKKNGSGDTIEEPLKSFTKTIPRSDRNSETYEVSLALITEALEMLEEDDDPDAL
ncbi:hypothetical protein O1611_g442 [Lasiodiplodia mahajangana]|uniref:Uncharacterized protein n=1 Tax=Lasiodiplodia mahajangana TaxID=1108764 RepID=A0ACC2K160_9PEZI|nr:hypothetical protein O1611_g442 [Lasiodiplodia mahajangana]